MSVKYKIWQLGRFGNIIYYSIDTKETFEAKVEDIIDDLELIDAFPPAHRKYLLDLRKAYKFSYIEKSDNA